MACVTSECTGSKFNSLLFPISCLLIKEQDLEIGKDMVIGKTTYLL